MEKDLVAVHQTAMQSFNRVQGAIRDVRMQCLADRRFYSEAGAQWEGAYGDQFQNKPRLEFNKIHLAVIRIINEYRNNRFTTSFSPADDKGSDKLIDIVSGMFRADEQDSDAQACYDNAFEEAVGGGFGAWRICAEYEDDEDDEDERQAPRFEPITDADSCVFFSLDAKKQDKSDAKECWVLTGMTREEFQEEFGQAAPVQKTVRMDEFDWCRPELVYVAEYYKVEKVKKEVMIYSDPLGTETRYTKEDFDKDQTLQDYLSATGSKLVRTKKVEKKQVRKYIMSGDRILEDCGIIPGQNIPIVPVYGKRWVYDGVERCMGHVRMAKDAQRLENMLRTITAQLAVTFKTEKPIFHPEQVSDPQIQNMWATDNVKDYPYLIVNKVEDENGQTVPGAAIGYTKAPNLPPAVGALLSVVEQDLSDLLGNQQAAEVMQSNQSGKAVELIQNKIDMQAFIYMDNFAKALKRSGEIWLSMKKDLTVEINRTVKVIQKDMQPAFENVNKEIVDEQGNMIDLDISKANLSVSVDIGPSSTSKKQATVRNLMGMLQLSQDPTTRSVLESAIMMNMEGEGLSDLSGFFRKKLVAVGAVKPTQEEMQEMQAGNQPDPNSVYLMSAAQEADSKAALNRANTVKTITDAEMNRAKTQEITINSHLDVQQQQLATIQALQQALQPNSNIQ